MTEALQRLRDLGRVLLPALLGAALAMAALHTVAHPGVRGADTCMHIR